MRLRRKAWPALAALAAAPLAACAPVGPDYVRPGAAVPAQYKEIKGWKLASPHDDLAKGEWWRLFADPTLDKLESQVGVSNQTIKADEANYRMALALIAEARAGLAPTINFDPSLTRVKSGTQLSDQLDAEVSGSWTLDVWGKTRRSVEQESAAAEASAADLANATLAAQSALALAYVQLRQSDSLADLLDSTVKQYKRSVDIAQNQYNVGAAAKSDVITAQALELAAEAQRVNAGVARAQSEHAIAVLTGRAPAELTIPHGKLALDAPRTPIRVPSELLERRPDIAAAERTMQAQNAAIGVAFAGYYPSLALNGAFGYSGDPFIKQIAGANPVWSYGLSIAQTLFNGGLTDAQVEAARQAYEASVATYRQTVLVAFQQVEDQLAAIPLESRQLSIQTEAVKAAEQAVEIALNEYRAGTQNFTTVVTAEATALSDEESALSTRAARLTATVNLIVALGGGWSASELPATPTP
jgi:NodT family efflux transporter outer membrane factor (OMF) lipoprotein